MCSGWSDTYSDRSFASFFLQDPKVAEACLLKVPAIKAA